MRKTNKILYHAKARRVYNVIRDHGHLTMGPLTKLSGYTRYSVKKALEILINKKKIHKCVVRGYPTYYIDIFPIHPPRYRMKRKFPSKPKSLIEIEKILSENDELSHKELKERGVPNISRVVHLSDKIIKKPNLLDMRKVRYMIKPEMMQ